MTLLRSLADVNFGSRTEIGPLNSLSISEPTRIIGSTFSNGTLDTSVWTSSVANGGTVVVGGGEVTLATNTTANGSAILTSVRTGRYVSGSSNYGRIEIQLGDTGTANNTRRWGVFNADNGAFFQLSGTTFSVVTRKSTVDTVVNSGSFNGTAPTLTTNSHVYEIHYTTEKVYFLVDDRVVHTVTASATPWSGTMHLQARMENVNSGGSTTNVTMKSRIANISRFGGAPPRAGYANINTASTSVLKVGPGTLRRVIVNDPGTTSTFTLYDNTAASGPIIATIDTSSGIASLGYDLDFNTGLTVVASATPGDITVVFD